MRIRFHQPPAAQRIGGLDAAIQSMQQAIASRGHEVTLAGEEDGAAPDLAHFHGLWQPAYGQLARKYHTAGIPYVVSPHGMLEPWAWRHKWWKKFPYWHLVERPWVARAASVLATSKAEAKRLASFLPKARIDDLPLGLTGDARADYVAGRERLGWRPDETVLLFLSRIHPKKGLHLLLSALERQEPWPAATRLAIVGPDEDQGYARACREFVTSHASRLPKIEWMGPVWGDARWSYLQGADLFCLPTHSENFGLVVLEACQVGTPALTTTETPWADLLPERGGLITQPNEQSVRGALDTFLAKPKASTAERAQLAAWAWETFHWDRLSARYESLYRELTG